MTIKKPEIVPGNVIATIRNCNGVYECPMSEEGKPLGPLVGYAGQYESGEDLLNYVGFVYYNVGKGDQWAHIAGHWAGEHAGLLEKFNPDLLVAAPMGGISYMSVLKQHLDCRGIFAEKKVIKVAQDGKAENIAATARMNLASHEISVVKGGSNKREESKLILGRYDIYQGDRVILIEDIVNNFSTTSKMIGLVESAGGIVVAIACIINRSEKVTYWESPDKDPLPVVYLQHKPTPQYKQNDPAVAEYVAAGNVIMKPKDRWSELVAAEMVSG